MASFFKVSARCHDGLVIMEMLARVWKRGASMPLEQISKETLSPFGYLEQIAASLKQSGLICGERGFGGGYKLARDPKRITVKEVIESVEGPIALVDCLGRRDGCEKATVCRTRGTWNNLQKKIEGAVSNITILDIL
ncbi:Rrf2 family transcriptional regulator [Candidatus Uhrbacteria bacterium]|nr:Rrf2 family transcriptional regulator [Candidatus Uhrbacteria bacterium]